jgi:hypothetical protein
MTFGDDHPPLWLREHPNVSVPLKVASSRGEEDCFDWYSYCQEGEV